MQQQPQPQDADYYIVLKPQFDKMINLIASLPYVQVAGLLNEIQGNVRPMVGEPPKFSGQGGRVVPIDPDADPDGDAGQTDGGGAKS